jgi:hypothetical protein
LYIILKTIMIIRALSTIIASVAVASNSADARRNLRTSFGIRRTQTNDSIKCVWDSNFDDPNLASHTKACKKLNDEHIAAYTCAGQYKNVCCTDSSIEFPLFEVFGQCQKVGSSTTVVGSSTTVRGSINSFIFLIIVAH